MASDFGKAIETVIRVHEGRFQKRVDDPGNWTQAGELKGTKFGISAHSFPDIDIENLTLNEAEAIYRQEYGHLAAINDQRVLTKILDLAVNMQFATDGPATRILQKAIVARGIPIPVDGDFGPRTITSCNNLDPVPLLDEICRQAVTHYKEIEATRPEMKAWFDNWEHRAEWVPPLE